MASKKSESITFFREAFDATRMLSDEQFGALMRSAYQYRFHGESYSGDDSAVAMAFGFLSNQIDRYSEACKAKADAARDRWEKEKGVQKVQNDADSTESCVTMQDEQNDAPILSFPILSNPNVCSTAEPPPTPKPKRTERGQYGWVKLTDAEVDRLIADLGEAEYQRCVSYIDESAQSTGNKNRWKDWNLVIRKCSREGWGKNRAVAEAPPQEDKYERYIGKDGLEHCRLKKTS